MNASCDGFQDRWQSGRASCAYGIDLPCTTPILGPDPIPAARAAVLAALPQPCTVAGLAAALGVDRTTLYRALRQRGTTPSAVIREVRLGRAADALREGASATEAGQAAGYASRSAFSRAFARHHGVTPTAWADAHRLHTLPADCNILHSTDLRPGNILPSR